MSGMYVVSLACWWSEAGSSRLEVFCTLALLLLALLLFCCRALSLLLSDLLLFCSLVLLLSCSFALSALLCVCVLSFGVCATARRARAYVCVRVYMFVCVCL